jgi:Flp pilus assembly protein TadG
MATVSRGTGLGAFGGDAKGSIAIIFALACLVLMGCVGLSIDGARIYNAQQRLQMAVDGAALAAARRAVLDGNSDQIEATFVAYLDATTAIRDMAVTAKTVDSSLRRTVKAEVVADVQTSIMPILGFDKVELHAAAAVAYGFNKIEVALALDNTGSMAGTKLDALKDSAKRLVDTLLDRAPEPGSLRFALVPFAQYVNVGIGNRTANWITVPDDYTESGESCRDVAPVISKSNCRIETYTYSNDGMPMTGSYEVCDYEYGTPVYTCTPYTTTHTWNGCVGSRNYPLNITDGSYGTRNEPALAGEC